MLRRKSDIRMVVDEVVLLLFGDTDSEEVPELEPDIHSTWQVELG